MNKLCRSRITKMLLSGNNGAQNISKKLLVLSESMDKPIQKITTISEKIEVSKSTLSRYIYKSGYPSFKHFSYDFNYISNDENKHFDEDTSLSDYYTTAKRISKSVEGDRIWIISSKRGKSIGKLMNERLNDGGFDNKLYHETWDELEDFVEKINGGTLFLITLSGHSRVISKTLSLISAMKNNKPKIIILTAGKWMDMFQNTDFISIGKIKKRDYKIDDWNNYNLCLLDILTLVILIINKLEKKKKI